MIKYSLIGIDSSDTESTYFYNPGVKLIESLQIKLIKDDNSEIVSRHIIRKPAAKFSFTIDDNAYYRICAQNVSPSAFSNKKIYIKLRIESENSESINLSNAIKHSDVNNVSTSIEKIISRVTNIN